MQMQTSVWRSWTASNMLGWMVGLTLVLGSSWSYAQPKPHPLADVFPQRTLAAVVVEKSGKGLEHLHRSLSSWGAGLWGTQAFQSFQDTIRKDLSARQPFGSLPQWLTALGIKSHKPAGIGLLYSHLMKTAGPLVVTEMVDFAAAHSVLRGQTGLQLMQPFWKACQRSMHHYVRRLQRRSRRLQNRPIYYSQIRGAYGGGSFFKWCALMRSCRVMKGKLTCRAGKQWLSPEAWLPAHWKTRTWPVKKRGKWMTFGSVKGGFHYAIWKNRYLVFSSHTYFLASAMRSNSLRMPLGGQVFVQSPSQQMQMYVSHLRVRLALRALSHVPGLKRMPGLQSMPSWALQWLSRIQTGIVVTQASLQKRGKHLEWSGRISLTRRSPYHAVFKTPSKPLDDNVGWVPAKANWVLMHRSLKSFVTAVLPVRRKFSRRGMVIYSILTMLGERMSLSLLPGRKGPFRLLVQLDVQNSYMFRKLLSQAYRIFPAMSRVLQTTTYRGYTIKKGVAPKTGTSFSYMLYKGRMFVALEPNERDSTLLQQILDWVVYQPHSLMERKPIQQAIQGLGSGQALLYSKTLSPATQPTSRPTSRPFASLGAWLGGVSFLPTSKKNPSHYKFKVRVTP